MATDPKNDDSKKESAKKDLDEARDALGMRAPVSMPGSAPVPPAPPIGGEIRGAVTTPRAPHRPGNPAAAPSGPVRAHNPLFDGPDAGLIQAGRALGACRQTLAGIAAGIDQLSAQFDQVKDSEQFAAACDREGIDPKVLAKAVADLEKFLDNQKPREADADAEASK